MTLDDVKRKGMVSELVSRLAKAENDLRQLLIQSPALPGARIYSNANQSIPNNALTALTFSTVTFDQAEFWAIANPSRLTIASPGVYWISGLVRFAVNATNERAISIRLNGLTTLKTFSNQASAASEPRISVDELYPLVAGDYVEIIVYQNSGGALNSLTVGIESPLAEIQRVS